MITYNQTLRYLMGKSRIERALANLFFGQPRRGFPAYEDKPTFHSTYPREWRPSSTEEYNRWINQVHTKRPDKKR